MKSVKLKLTANPNTTTTFTVKIDNEEVDVPKSPELIYVEHDKKKYRASSNYQ